MAAEGSPTVIDSPPRQQDDEDAPGARSTEAFCGSAVCGRKIGEFYNSWIRVTGSYFLPALEASYRLTGLGDAGRVKPASSGSSLAGW